MKKLSLKFLALILLISLCGCSENSQNNTDTDVLSNPNLSLSSDISETIDQTDETGTSIQMIVDWPGLLNTPLACSLTGCYEIMYSASDYSANILYTDIGTKQRIYLSPYISANHHSESDPSWIENAFGGCFVFVTENNLYLCRFGYEDTPGELYQMALDGSNRKSLTKFTDYEAPTGAVAYADGCIYTLLTNNGNYSLVKIHMDTGAIEPLLDLGENSAFLMSAYEDSLVLKIIKPGTQSEEDPLEAYYSQTHTLYTYCLKDSSFAEITSWKQDEIMETYSGNHIYMFDKPNDCLRILNMSTGHKDTLISSLNASGFFIEQLSSVLPVYDNHIICRLYNENEIYEKFIDIPSGKIGDMELYKDDQHLGIIGEYGDNFLVVSGSLEIPVDGTAPDGSPITVMMGMSDLSVIRKDDLWNNKFNLQQIENVFLE